MPDAGLTGVPATLGLQRWGGALSRLQPPQTGAPWVGPGPLPSLEEWKAKPWESWSSVQASSPAAPSRRRSDTAGTAVWICEHRRQEGGTGAAALPRWDLPEDWRYVWASALWRGAGRIDHASPSFPALPPQTHQPFSTLRLRQAATGQSGGGRDTGAASGAGGKGGTLSVSGGGGRGGGWAREERASDLASGEHREAPPAPAAGQAARRGLRDLARPRDCPPGATIQEPSALLWLLPAALPPHCLAPGRPARARQGLALPRGHRAGTQEPGLRSRVQPGAEVGTEWRAPPTPARGHPQPGWGGSDPPRLLLGSTSDASQHGPPPSLIRKSQVSARPLQPPKESPQTRGKGPETPGRGLCPGQARGPGGDREASELPRPSPRPSRAPSPAPLGVALYLGLRPRGSGAGPAESRSVVPTWQPAFSSGDWSSEQFYNPGEVRYPVATSREAVYAAPARSGIRRGGETLATPTLPPLL